MNTFQYVSVALLAGAAFVLQLANSFVGIPTGFGMTVDVAAVPVLLAFFVLGYEAALYVLALLALLIAFTPQTSFVGAVMKFAATLPMILVPAVYLFARKRKMDPFKLAGLLALSLLALSVLFALSSYLYAFSSAQFSSPAVAAVLPTLLVLAFSYLLLRLWRARGKDVELSRLANLPDALLVLALAVVLRGLLMVVANFYFAGPLFFKMSPADFSSFVEGNAALPLLGKGAWHWIIFLWNAVQGVLEFAVAWTLAYRFKFAAKYGA